MCLKKVLYAVNQYLALKIYKGIRFIKITTSFIITLKKYYVRTEKSYWIFPDKGKSFKKWSDRIDTTCFTMNDLLENSDSPEGSDLADYILRI